MCHLYFIKHSFKWHIFKTHCTQTRLSNTHHNILPYWTLSTIPPENIIASDGWWEYQSRVTEGFQGRQLLLYPLHVNQLPLASMETSITEKVSHVCRTRHEHRYVISCHTDWCVTIPALNMKYTSWIQITVSIQFSLKFINDSVSFPVMASCQCWQRSKTTRKRDKLNYRKISHIRHTNSQNFTDSRLVLQLPLPNPLKPGIKSRMKI